MRKKQQKHNDRLACASDHKKQEFYNGHYAKWVSQRDHNTQQQTTNETVQLTILTLHLTDVPQKFFHDKKY
jgi:hypothetical protein